MPVAFVLKGYPRLSETFIAQEIHGLERMGLDIRIFSLRQPTDRARHPIHGEIRAPVTYLPEYLHRAPLRVWRSWRLARRFPGYKAAIRAWLRDLRRDPTRNRVRRFGQALTMAAELPAEVSRLHAHFLHTPASVARYAALLTGRPWSCSAHAKDVWTTPDWEKAEKLAAVDWLVTCTRQAAVHLAALTVAPERVELVYHGIDLSRFPPPAANRFDCDGRAPERAATILSVGRAVEKKGYDVLLRALCALPPDMHWRLVHIGGGPLLDDLKAQARSSGIADRIDWRGAQPQEAVLDAYRRADIFVLACRVARDNDRDGLPNVLMEAQSQALPCLSSNIAGIPELIIDGETGLLVEPDDPAALADALARLIADPALRQRLGDAGASRVRHAFDHRAGLRRLARKFGLAQPRSAKGRTVAR